MRYVDGQASSSGGRDRAAAGLLLAGVTAFQVSLAAGTPWGRLAWGGSHEGVLPTDLRVASALRGGCGGSVVGAALNLASPSPPERALWAPVTAAVAVLTGRASRALAQ